ncbi:MAG: ATP-binding protein [Clostridia bacterium]|nr:ATP-binding protein [Clostridia bacterium]
MGKLYTKDSIESLSPLEFTRLRPGVYCGNTEYSTQLLVEIVSNAIDEYRNGFGAKIEVTINKDVVTVKDNGQGFIPNSFREDGKTILEAAFSVLNTSGKYREDGTYEGTSLGSFGIGSKITTFLSHWLEVKTTRDSKVEKIRFKEGVFEKRETWMIRDAGTSHGTVVSWQPSEEFFTHTEVEINKIKDLFQTIVCLCPGLKIVLNLGGDNSIIYESTRGLDDLVDAAVAGKELIDTRFNMSYSEPRGKNKMDMVLTYTSNYSSTIVPYVNTGLTETGQHITQIKTIITREFNKFFKEKKWLKSTDENLSGEDLQEGMYIVFNLTAPNVSYDAQVKSRITKIDMKPFTTVLGEQLAYWLNNNEKEIKLIADKAINAKKAREAAKKAREKAREQGKKKEKVLKIDSKLADCYSKDRSCCEIYITEGDSASGNLKSARNNEFQAVLPVRGKILNVHKATIDKIQKNAEIMTMIDAFGLKIDTKTMKVTYNANDLRYDKIIIMSDADVDGAHIKNLFYTFIWNFCPQLIYEGHVYAGVPPLYKITLAGNKGYKYLKNDEELEKFRKTHTGKYTVNRLKGLGEMSVEETEETLIDPKNRIIKQITIEDSMAAGKLFDDLMGTAILPRKKYIQEHSEEAEYNV